MHRRKILSVVAATLLAGCGWSQERRDFSESADTGTGDGQADGSQSGDNTSSEDEQTPEPLESEAGETLIERDGEELLLPVEGFLGDDGWAEVDGWQEQNVITTHPCHTFSIDDFGRSVRECQYCVIVADTEDASKEEFETFAGLSEKEQPPRTRTFLEEKDINVQIGDDSAVYSASQEVGQFEEERLVNRTRVVYRDTNVVGTVDYSEQTWTTSELDVRDARDVADLAVRMHQFWRDE